MAFVNELRSVRDPFPEWEYLNKIGVKNMFGEPLHHYTTSLVVDREKNYYLVRLGHTGLAYDNEDIHFYALCMENCVINLEVVKKASGNPLNNTYRCSWDIRKIVYPCDWSVYCRDNEEVVDILTEAFYAETLNRNITEEYLKELIDTGLLTVIITHDFNK